MFFWEQADPATGIVRDRSRTDGGPANEQATRIGSIASVGFGLSGMCIAAERGWLPRQTAVGRARTTVLFLERVMPHEHGWFHHFVNAKTGERVWQQRVDGVFSASPVGGGGHVYFVSENGDTVVVKAGRSPEIVARNAIAERALASPAIASGRLFIRTDDHLFAIGK